MNMAARSMCMQQMATAPQAAAAPSLRCAVRVRCVQPPRALRWAPRAAVHTAAALGGREGGSVLDRPSGGGWNSDRDTGAAGGTALKTDTGSGSGNTDNLRSTPPGGGSFRVLLLRSEKHTEKGVVRAITQTVPNTDVNHATNVYKTSVALGMGIVTTCLKEHAEHYAQQLYRAGCKTAIEPDTATLN